MSTTDRFLLLAAIVAAAAMVGAVVNALLRRRHQIERIDPADLDDGTRVVVFTSPYCHGCKQWLAALSADSIGATAIDIAERPDAAARYRVSSTPRVVVVGPSGTVLQEFHHFEPRRSDLDRIVALENS